MPRVEESLNRFSLSSTTGSLDPKKDRRNRDEAHAQNHGPPVSPSLERKARQSRGAKDPHGPRSEYHTARQRGQLVYRCAVEGNKA